MIKSMELINFKCFNHIQIPLSDLTIFAGSNASGKSTIIQALLLADATAREKGDFVDVSSALGVEAGNPKALVSQNRIETAQGEDFFIDYPNAGAEKLFPFSVPPANSKKF